jgi:hypothetical protein
MSSSTLPLPSLHDVKWRSTPRSGRLTKTRNLFYRRMVGPQGRCRRVRKISPPPGFDARDSAVGTATALS